MRYFPDPVSGWVFMTFLFAVLAIATWTDQRWMKVPKWLTLTALALGLLASLLRGAWLSAHGSPVWIMGSGSVLAGAFDGLLFSLAGFAVGFLLFFGMWLLGVCGGGDVKLFAALGAWIGPGLVFWVMALSLLLLWAYVLAVFVLRMLGVRHIGGAFKVRGSRTASGVGES